jgi:Ni/Fe-hydrogenase 1 B-type cytochrome subunit
MTTLTATDVHDAARLRPLYIFEAPVRVWHWVHALSIVVLSVTGWFIANPLPSVPGEASESFLMGNIRLIHFIAGYVFAVGFLVRIYWALVGNRYARELFVLPVWRPAWWKGLFYELRFYAFLTRTMHRETGHNPLAQSSYFVFNVLGTLFMLFTGFALYGEGLGDGSWADGLFGWVIPLIGDAEAVHNWHNLGMWLMILFVIIHVYMAIRADIMSRQSSISTMVGGWRYYKDDRA